jgi:inosose dehydratase
MSEAMLAPVDRKPRSARMKVANAPCSYGVDEVLKDDAWMPTGLEVLDMIAKGGYEGTELGPPGFLGTADELRARLDERNLALVGSFLPMRFSEEEYADEDRAWLRDSLTLVHDGAPEGSRPFAILCDGFDQPLRMALSGRIADHPEAWLPEDRFRVFMDNLHRAAEMARSMGFDVVLHPHAGTYCETIDEVRKVMDAMDLSLLGLCLDTGHLRYGGGDPAQLVRDYRDHIRHVHLKDARMQVIADCKRDDVDLVVALQRGVFCELGQGDSGLPEVVDALDEVGYEGWLVVEQDRGLTMADTLDTVFQSNVRNRDYVRSLGI